MKYSLAALANAAKKRRVRSILIREIVPPAMLATDLFISVYAPVLAAWASRLPSILAQYERSVSIRDGLIHDSAADVQGAIDEVSDLLSRLFLSLGPALRDWTVRVERYHRSKWRGAVLSASGVDIDTMLMASGEPVSVADTIAWNASLIRDVSDQTRKRISDAVFAGLTNRTPVRDVAKAMDEAVGLGRKRSRAIAQDQLSKITSSLDSERMADAGIERFKYRHSGKLHPRSTHKARDGKLYDLLTMKEIGGPDVIAPDDAPGRPPWCGCRKQAILDLE